MVTRMARTILNFTLIFGGCESTSPSNTGFNPKLNSSWTDEKQSVRIGPMDLNT
jgi:hypothetical protein